MLWMRGMVSRLRSISMYRVWRVFWRRRPAVGRRHGRVVFVVGVGVEAETLLLLMVDRTEGLRPMAVVVEVRGEEGVR